MEFICGSCKTEMTTEDVARQWLAVPHCIRTAEGGEVSHAGPFEVLQQRGRFQTRPEIAHTRNAVDA